MRIDSLQYNGTCSCGRDHRMQTELCVIESGCLKEIDSYLSAYGLNGCKVAVYDENTYAATADRHPCVDFEVILNPRDLHANEYGVEYLMKKLPKTAEVLIAVGSGTVHDLTRYCAYVLKTDFVSCPTAASVDGFCSSVAAMTWHGCKKTLTAVAPKIVVADLDIIKRAPMRLTRSGFGDMIGKYIALTDWKIGNLLTGEFYCERIAQMTMQATEQVLSSVEGIVSGADEAYEKLTYGLLLSGLAMQMMGNSRPASGAEHHVSHMIEMEPPCLNVHSEALHGEKVGVGTLLVLGEYHRMANIHAPVFAEYTRFSNEHITTLFGERMAAEIVAENERDCAETVTAEILKTVWEQICSVIAGLPTPERLEKIYGFFGVKRTLAEIGVRAELAESLLRNSHLVRNRLTLMRIKKCISE